MKNFAARILAVYCWCAAHFEIGVALQLWADNHKPEQYGHIKDPRHFIRFNGNKFLEHGTVGDLPHHPDTHKVPDAIIDQCCEELKGGYTGPHVPAGPGAAAEEMHHFYTSIRQACVKNDYLRDVCRDYKVTPQHLLKRMKKRDRDIKWRAVDYKPELTDAQKAARMHVAQIMLSRHLSDPNFLDSIWWIDEVAIWFLNTSFKVHVYADAHDARVHQVLHCKNMKKGKQYKVRALCAVNAMCGACFIEFMTGTTDVKRRHLLGAGPYMVRYGSKQVETWVWAVGT